MTIGMAVSVSSLQISVLFSIFNQYQRRSDSCSARVVGALLGSAAPAEDNSGSYQVRFSECFPVPHSEVGEQIAINSEYFKSQMELYKKSFSKDMVLLGWFSIQCAGALPRNTDSDAFAKNSDFIRDYFVRETAATGAPIVMFLNIVISADGNINYESLYCDAPRNIASTSANVTKSVLHSVPCSLSYGMAELFASTITMR
jgi:hypothetical protein